MWNILGMLLLLPLAIASQSSQTPTRNHGPQWPSPTFGQYVNPLPIALPDGSTMESCPDPSVIHSQTPGDDGWYMYCTNEVFHDNGTLHRMAISLSHDLSHWTYVADVFSASPAFLPANAGLWAPDIQFFNGKYYLYYSSSITTNSGPAIFVATSDHPAGPFTALPSPVVPPERLSNGLWRDVIDSNIAEENGQRYILYGSFNGGIVASRLTDDGFSSIPGSEQQISPGRRYEGSYIVKHEGYYYLFLSAGTCCSGAGSGYGVYVARAPHIIGPYLDRDGVSLMDAYVGGTPVLLMNGNRWLGPGHNSTFTDSSGQDWMLYHAVDSNKPTLAGAWTRRPAMIDPIDWSTGWPSVRAGSGPSDQLEPAPATVSSSPVLPENPAAQEFMGPLLPRYTDEFDAGRRTVRWSWTDGNAHGGTALNDGALLFATQRGDLRDAQHNAPMLSETAPPGDYVVEVKLGNNLPATGEHNSIESGLVIFQDNQHFLKLTLQSIDDTRQLEFARKDGAASWGRAYLAAAAPEMWLRIAHHGSTYTSYSSHDGVTWTRGPSWNLKTSSHARIALISAGGTGYISRFEYIRVGERQ
jgi:arabinan endo-1,5-alpha-L-arabinosidase